MIIRCMSVRQPFAQLLARGTKPVENRDRWKPPRWAMISTEEVWIAFHAGKALASNGDVMGALHLAFQPTERDREAVNVLLQLGYRRGAIVGAARFVGWCDQATIHWARSARPEDQFAGNRVWFDSPWRSPRKIALCFADAVEFSEPFLGVPGQQAVWWDPNMVPLHKAPPQPNIEERIRAELANAGGR